jgi:hypothetical protein
LGDHLLTRRADSQRPDRERGQGRYDRSLDDCLVILKLARQDAKVDYPVGWLVDDVDDFGGGWRILVTGHDDGTGLDKRLVARVPFLNRPVAVPTLAKLVIKDATSASRLWLACRMAQMTAQALPGRKIHITGDAAASRRPRDAPIPAGRPGIPRCSGGGQTRG